jgi:serine/threonine protein kinase
VGKGKEAATMREVEIARAILPEYVVSILESFIEKGFLYLVNEYYEKGTLASVVENVKKIEETNWRNIFKFFQLFIFFFDIDFCI